MGDFTFDHFSKFLFARTSELAGFTGFDFVLDLVIDSDWVLDLGLDLGLFILDFDLDLRAPLASRSLAGATRCVSLVFDLGFIEAGSTGFDSFFGLSLIHI